MGLGKINTLRIEGNNNVSIQDVTGSTVNVNILTEKKTNFLTFLVISTTKDRLYKVDNNEIKNILPIERYGSEPKNWKPYNNENEIIELLKEFHLQSGFYIQAYFFDNNNVIEDDILTDLKSNDYTKLIVIVDGISLYFNENKDFAKIFDIKNIGACLFPICNEYSKIIQSFIFSEIKSTFKVLYKCFDTKFREQIMFVETNISTKHLLFRRLTNIAIKHLSIEPSPVEWDDIFSKIKNTGEIMDLNLIN